MKTRTLCLLAIMLASIGWVNAQVANQIDYNKIILPAVSDTTNIKEKIVFLAWQNNPQIRRSELLHEKADAQLKIARSQWLSAFSVTGNLNEFNIGPTFSGRPQEPNPGNFFFPRYNFGVFFTLDYFSRVKNNVRIARAEKNITGEEHNLLKLQIRADALSKYQIYYTARELYKYQLEITEDAYVKYLSIEQQFKNGERTLEDYEIATRTYKNSQIARLIAEKEYFLAKYDLEKLIGIPIEQVK